MSVKKVLIMAGGTGGHVFPGLSVAHELKRRDISVEWLGTEKGIESNLVPKEDIFLHRFPVSGIRGKGPLALLMAPFNIFRSVWSAYRLIREIKPNLVVGMGGFVSGPGGLAAKLLGIPLVIHEQNAVMGTTNRLLTYIAHDIFTAFPFYGKDNEKIYRHVGNPVREKIEQLAKPEERGVGQDSPVKILILGGSRGALALNIIVPKVLAKVSASISLEILHQCGSGKEDSAKDTYANVQLNAKIAPFIDNMPDAFAWADFVICRSGALTVSELSAVGIGSLLIPYPYAIDDHQTANASLLTQNNAAILVQEKDIDIDVLAHRLTEIFTNKNKILNMAKNARSQSQIHSAVKIVDVCEELIYA